jgi:hypothetical protein
MTNLHRVRGEAFKDGDILSACAKLACVAVADMMGKGRHRRVVLARTVFAGVMRHCTGRSFPEIASITGRHNHSVMYEASKRFDGLDPELQTEWITKVLAELDRPSSTQINEQRRAEIAEHCRRIDDIHSITMRESPARKDAVRAYLKTVTDVLPLKQYGCGLLP